MAASPLRLLSHSAYPALPLSSGTSQFSSCFDALPLAYATLTQRCCQEEWRKRCRYGTRSSQLWEKRRTRFAELRSAGDSALYWGYSSDMRVEAVSLGLSEGHQRFIIV